MTANLSCFEIIQNQHQTTLGKVKYDWNPQPGSYIEVLGQSYVVLERRHHYRLKMGRYTLDHVALYVQSAEIPTDFSWVGGHQIIGNINCQFNARSTLIRCAVNPEGPCDRCPSFQTEGSTNLDALK